MLEVSREIQDNISLFGNFIRSKLSRKFPSEKVLKGLTPNSFVSVKL